MKAPIRIGLLPGMKALYIERHDDYWLVPTNTNPTRDLGTFIRLYDNGAIEVVYKENQPPWERVELIKPKSDKGE